MKRLKLPNKWVRFVEAYSTKNFRARAHDTLKRDILQRSCPNCQILATLVCDGFGDDGSIGLICLNCGANLQLYPNDKMDLEHESQNKNYRDYLRADLAAKGIDWRTGQAAGR